METGGAKLQAGCTLEHRRAIKTEGETVDTFGSEASNGPGLLWAISTM
jgi:hypothetical protein